MTKLPDFAVTESECWARLESARVGRVAFTTGHGPAIAPVSYLAHAGSIFFRSGPGQKVDELWLHPRAAFEIDGNDGEDFWSVVLEGDTRMLAIDDPRISAQLAGLESPHPAAKTMIIEIVPSKVTGVRFAQH